MYTCSKRGSLGWLHVTVFSFFRTFPQSNLPVGQLSADHCKSQFYVSPCSGSSDRSWMLLLLGTKALSFSVPSEMLILWFILFQIMCFSNMFLWCSTFSLAIMKLVLKNNNKMYRHLFLWRQIMTLATCYK